MNRSDFRQLFAYSDRCWRLLGETLTAAAAPDAWNAPFPTTSSWNTIRLLLVHCIGAEERLVGRRLQNQPIPVAYEERASSEQSGVYQEQQTIRAATYAYMDRLTDAEWEDTTPVLPATAERGPLTRADVLFQVLNHENYHRGQVIMTLQRWGMDPPNFDYMLLKSVVTE